jgi:hypothetical protein
MELAEAPRELHCLRTCCWEQEQETLPCVPFFAGNADGIEKEVEKSDGKSWLSSESDTAVESANDEMSPEQIAQLVACGMNDDEHF